MPRLFVALFLFILPLAASAQQHALVKAQTYLSLREKAASNAKQIEQLLRFQPVKVLERNKDWARVQTVRADPAQSKTGWVLANFLSETGFVTVDHEKQNVRTGPGTEYPIIMNYSKPYPIFVLDVANNGWVKVMDVDGDRGWVHPKYLTFSPRYVITRLDPCNVRAGGGTDYDTQPIVFTCSRGVFLEVLEHKDGWLRVRHAQGDEGWISAKIVFGWNDEKIPTTSR